MEGIMFNRFNSKSQNNVISIDDLKEILKISIKGIDEEDFKCLFDQIVQTHLQEISFQKFCQIYLTFDHEAKKVFSRIQPPICSYLFQSLVYVQNQKLVMDSIYHEQDKTINIQKEFSQILTQNYLKKLIMGANGIINDKQEQKVQAYYYNHWVQTKVDFAIVENEKYQIQLLKKIWSFSFTQAYQIANLISLENQDDFQIQILLPGLSNVKQIHQLIKKNPLSQKLILNRKNFDISIKDINIKTKEIQNQGYLNQLQLNNLICQIKQYLSFTIEYFQNLISSLENPYYRQISKFLSNDKDLKAIQRTQSEIEQLVQMEEIGVIQRFYFAKKFYNQNDFKKFVFALRVRAEKSRSLDYILLFGTKKESQQILQNYLNQTNDIEKVALISVYLKIFSQQSKIRQEKALCTKFIKVYEWLLDKKDGGISRHLFDKKCLSIQIQRKRKNLTKTFSFDCSNCKGSQLYAALAKRISLDSRQPKLKGYHYFAKDTRNQLMHCIDCMELLPKCSICLYPITVFNVYAEEMKKSATNQNKKKVLNKGQILQNALIWCPKCKHGGHLNHVMEWFQSDKRKCPVANCKCKCSF